MRGGPRAFRQRRPSTRAAARSSPVDPERELVDWCRAHHRELTRSARSSASRWASTRSIPANCAHGMQASVRIADELTDYLQSAQARPASRPATGTSAPPRPCSWAPSSPTRWAATRCPSAIRSPMREAVEQYVDLLLDAIGACPHVAADAATSPTGHHHDDADASPTRPPYFLPSCRRCPTGARRHAGQRADDAADARRRASRIATETQRGAGHRARRRSARRRRRRPRRQPAAAAGQLARRATARTLASEFSGALRVERSALCARSPSIPARPLTDRVARARARGRLRRHRPGLRLRRAAVRPAQHLPGDASFSQAVYTGGRITAAAAQAELLAARRLDRHDRRLQAELALDVTRAFYDAALGDRLVAIAESGRQQAVGRLRAGAARVRRRPPAGVRAAARAGGARQPAARR